jgi:hypothetical protein
MSLDPSIEHSDVATGVTSESNRAALLLASRAPWVLAVLLVFGVQLIPTLDAVGPMVFEDEIGYLMNGRTVLGAGSSASLGEMGFYFAGWSLLMTPVLAIFSDPGHAYRAVLVLVAALSALQVLPLAWIGRHLLALSPMQSIATAAAVALYPGQVLMSGYAYAEAAFSLCFLLAVVAVFRWTDLRSTGSAVLLGGLVGLLYAIHGRGLGIVVLTLVLFALAAIRWRRLEPLIGIATLILVMVAAELLHRWLKAEIYNLAYDRLATGLGNITRMRPRPTLTAVSGQIWYLTVASLGVAVLGVLEIATRLWGTARRSKLRAWLWLVLSLGAVAAVTVPGFADAVARGPARLDYTIYGRYLDSVLPVVLVFGLGQLWRRPPLGRLAIAAAVAVGAGVGLQLMAQPSAIEGRPIAALSVAGIAAWMDPAVERIPLVEATIGTLVALAGVALVPGRLVWPRVALVASGFLVLAWVGEMRTMRVLDRPWQNLLTLHEVVADLAPENVGYDLVAYSLYGRNGYQYWLPEVEFMFFDGASELPGTAVVIGRLEWSEGERQGALRLAAEERINEAVWILPGELQDSLIEAGRL